MMIPGQQQPIQVGVPSFGISQDPCRYVNGVAIRASQWDIAMDLVQQFALPGPIDQSPQSMNQIVCRTIMSPQHAKALAHYLQQAVDGWEEKFGPLPSIEVLMPSPPEGGPSVA
jgi:hypothetical protein